MKQSDLLNVPEIRAAYFGLIHAVRSHFQKMGTRTVSLGPHGQHKHGRKAEAAIASLMNEFFKKNAGKIADQIVAAYSKERGK